MSDYGLTERQQKRLIRYEEKMQYQAAKADARDGNFEGNLSIFSPRQQKRITRITQNSMFQNAQTDLYKQYMPTSVFSNPYGMQNPYAQQQQQPDLMSLFLLNALFGEPKEKKEVVKEETEEKKEEKTETEVKKEEVTNPDISKLKKNAAFTYKVGKSEFEGTKIDEKTAVLIKIIDGKKVKETHSINEDGSLGAAIIPEVEINGGKQKSNQTGNQIGNQSIIATTGDISRSFGTVPNNQTITANQPKQYTVQDQNNTCPVGENTEITSGDLTRSFGTNVTGNQTQNAVDINKPIEIADVKTANFKDMADGQTFSYIDPKDKQKVTGTKQGNNVVLEYVEDKSYGRSTIIYNHKTTHEINQDGKMGNITHDMATNALEKEESKARTEESEYKDGRIQSTIIKKGEEILGNRQYKYTQEGTTEVETYENLTALIAPLKKKEIKNKDNQPIEEITYEADGEIESLKNYTYDAQGNQTGESVSGFKADGAKQMTMTKDGIKYILKPGLKNIPQDAKKDQAFLSNMDNWEKVATNYASEIDQIEDGKKMREGAKVMGLGESDVKMLTDLKMYSKTGQTGAGAITANIDEKTLLAIDIDAQNITPEQKTRLKEIKKFIVDQYTAKTDMTYYHKIQGQKEKTFKFDNNAQIEMMHNKGLMYWQDGQSIDNIQALQAFMDQGALKFDGKDVNNFSGDARTEKEIYEKLKLVRTPEQQ